MSRTRASFRAGFRPAVLLSFLLASACASRAPSPNTDPDVVALLTHQADDWDKAIVRKDLAAIAANMTDDFRQIRYNGSVVDRESFLRDITSPDLTIDPYTVEDLDVRVYGEVALLSGRTHMTGRYAGEAFVTHYRYVDVYVRRDGRWRVCNVQITSIPEKKGK